MVDAVTTEAWSLLVAMLTVLSDSANYAKKATCSTITLGNYLHGNDKGMSHLSNSRGDMWEKCANLIKWWCVPFISQARITSLDWLVQCSTQLHRSLRNNQKILHEVVPQSD